MNSNHEITTQKRKRKSLSPHMNLSHAPLQPKAMCYLRAMLTPFCSTTWEKSTKADSCLLQDWAHAQAWKNQGIAVACKVEK